MRAAANRVVSWPWSCIPRRHSSFQPLSSQVHSYEIHTVKTACSRTVRTSIAKSLPNTLSPHSYRTMSRADGAWGAWQLKPASFTNVVVDAMRKLFPEELADTRWDNVGLLLDNPEFANVPTKKPIVMVVNDLTYQVATEAIQAGVSVIVTYHPIIFSGLKSLTGKDPQQSTLLHLAQAGIAVYCPHSAVDAAPEGLSTWLADVVAGPHPITRSAAVPCDNAPSTHSPAGYGAIGRFSSANGQGKGADTVPLTEILKRVASELGGLRHVMLAAPGGARVQDARIGSFAVCAGSGYGVLKNADVDLLVMGETDHHSALKAVQQGRFLLQVFHSNSERTYLQKVLVPKLKALLDETAPGAQVIYSEKDADPFRIIDVTEL